MQWSRRFLWRYFPPCLFGKGNRSNVHHGRGAPLEDLTPEGTISEKTGPKYWNGIYHQKPDGTFEDVTEKAGLQGRATRATAWVLRWEITTTTTMDLYVTVRH
jgi:hypothetical protein